jgi:hypothetical protein
VEELIVAGDVPVRHGGQGSHGADLRVLAGPPPGLPLSLAQKRLGEARQASPDGADPDGITVLQQPLWLPKLLDRAERG